MNLSTLFCLKGKSNADTNHRETSMKQDEFGWWLSDESDVKSPRSTRSKTDCQSLGSSESMVSCMDSDDSESYFLAQEFKQECGNDGCEKIELTTLIHDDLDVNLIEEDAVRKKDDVTPLPAEPAKRCYDNLKAKPRAPHGVSYTPERLVRSREYRILAPSPPYLSISQPRIVEENVNSPKTSHCRRRLNYLIDAKQVGVTELKLEARSKERVVPMIGSHQWKNYKRICYGGHVIKIDNENEEEMNESVLSGSIRNKSDNSQTLDPMVKKTSYDKLNITWEDIGGRMGTRSSSLDDTSGIQSNDWSSDTHSDLQNTPLSLCDELAATSYKLDVSQERYTAINEVVSILEVLDTNPDKATVLLEEDRFCESTSSHDQLTRLALAIETDTNVPGDFEKPDHLIHRLQNKVKTLEANSKDIYRDISDLRKSFQSEEQRMADISSHTTKLRQDVHELRHLDDLLNLLRGELERISKRNWPFVVARSDHHPEELNLIV